MYTRIVWCSQQPLDYGHCVNILNPWNGNRVINFSKEFQPVETGAALQLIELLDNPPLHAPPHDDSVEESS